MFRNIVLFNLLKAFVDVTVWEPKERNIFNKNTVLFFTKFLRRLTRGLSGCGVWPLWVTLLAVGTSIDLCIDHRMMCSRSSWADRRRFVHFKSADNP